VFPLTFDENKVKLLRLRTLTFHELQGELKNIGCEILAVYGAHSITNIIPTTVMQQDHPGRIARGLFSILKAVEDRVYGIWPFSRTGVSIMVIAKKER
jgi:hypothetical protein